MENREQIQGKHISVRDSRAIQDSQGLRKWSLLSKAKVAKKWWASDWHLGNALSFGVSAVPEPALEPTHILSKIIILFQRIKPIYLKQA